MQKALILLLVLGFIYIRMMRRRRG